MRGVILPHVALHLCPGLGHERRCTFHHDPSEARRKPLKNHEERRAVWAHLVFGSSSRKVLRFRWTTACSDASWSCRKPCNAFPPIAAFNLLQVLSSMPCFFLCRAPPVWGSSFGTTLVSMAHLLLAVVVSETTFSRPSATVSPYSPMTSLLLPPRSLRLRVGKLCAPFARWPPSFQPSAPMPWPWVTVTVNETSVPSGMAGIVAVNWDPEPFIGRLFPL